MRELSLDSVDAFLLLQIRGTTSFEALLASAPCDEEQLTRRLRALSHHGLVELITTTPFDDDAITSLRPAPNVAPRSEAPTVPPRPGASSGVFDSVATRPFLQALEEA